MTCSPGKDRALSPISGWPSRPASAGPRSTGTGRPRRTCSATCSSQPSCHSSPPPPCPCGPGCTHSGASARPHRHITAITERLAAAFALAVDAGELDTAPDAALAAAHLIGPLAYRTTLQAAPVPDRLLTAVIDAVAPRRQPALAPAPGATAQAG